MVNWTGYPTFANCLFAGNRAQRGGAVYVVTSGGTTSVNVHSCTIAANHATEYRGGIEVSFVGAGALTLFNSILWGNTDSQGGGESAQLRFQASRSTIGSCGIEGWEGNFVGFAIWDFDPLFADPLGPDGESGTLDDDYRLQATSPYRDAGSSALLGPDLCDVDLDGDTTEQLPLDLDGTARRHDDAFRLAFDTEPEPAPDFGAYETPAADPGCSAARFCVAAPSSTGVGALISPIGSLSAARNDFTLFAGPIHRFQWGLFYYGAEAIQLPFGDGVRCVGEGGTGIFRLVPTTQADHDGYATRRVDLGAPPAGLGRREHRPRRDVVLPVLVPRPDARHVRLQPERRALRRPLPVTLSPRSAPRRRRSARASLRRRGTRARTRSPAGSSRRPSRS